MPSDVDTIKGIERNLESMQSYGSWHIGRTRDPLQREVELGYPPFWRVWDVDSVEEAARVTDYFLHKGMEDDGVRGKKATRVYLY